MLVTLQLVHHLPGTPLPKVASLWVNPKATFNTSRLTSWHPVLLASALPCSPLFPCLPQLQSALLCCCSCFAQLWLLWPCSPLRPWSSPRFCISLFPSSPPPPSWGPHENLWLLLSFTSQICIFSSCHSPEPQIIYITNFWIVPQSGSSSLSSSMLPKTELTSPPCNRHCFCEPPRSGLL